MSRTQKMIPLSRPARKSVSEQGPAVSVVISTWNKRDDLRENLTALLQQTLKPAEIIVVDNASKDGTVEMVRNDFPQVRLIEMADSFAGACETFNIGFKAVQHGFTAIMDDDVVAPPEWLETIMKRFSREPASTAMISSKVVEPEMPEEYLQAAEVNRERYMATFRGCATVAKTEVLRQVGYYDERFFIYGNERDLAARVLNAGMRILQYPPAQVFHKTPFGMKAGKRSLFYHTRNFWLYSFKHCPWSVVFSSAFKLVLKGTGLNKSNHRVKDAVGTIGIEKTLKETKGGIWIAFKATLAAIALLPYCLRVRSVCRSKDFLPPLS